MPPINSTRLQQAIDYCLNKGFDTSESAKHFGVPEKQLNYLITQALNPYSKVGTSASSEIWTNFENSKVVKAKLVADNQEYYLVTMGVESHTPKMTAYDKNGNAINVNNLKKTYGIERFELSGSGEITLVAGKNSKGSIYLEQERDEDGYIDTLEEYKEEGMGALEANSLEVTQNVEYSEDLAKNPVTASYNDTLEQDTQIREQTVDLLIQDTKNAIAMLTDYRESFGYASWDAVAQGIEVIGNITIDEITGSNAYVTIGENKEVLEEQLKKLEHLKEQTNKPETFAKEFKEIFGTDYNPENFHNLTQTSEKFKEMSAYSSLSKYFGAGIEKLKSSDVSDFEAAGMLAPLFKNGVIGALEYINNIKKISPNDDEFKNNLITVLENSKKSIDSNLKDVDLESLENAYRQRYKNAMGSETSEETIDAFINNSKRNAMFTEVGISIASGSLMSGYGRMASVVAGASPSAIEEITDGATGGTGNLQTAADKFTNNMMYGVFGAYVSGPLGNGVSKVLSNNGNVFKNIVSNHKFTQIAGTTAETTADVLFDGIMSDMSFQESLEQNGLMNFGMMFVGGNAYRKANSVNPDLPNVDMSQIKIEKMSDGTFNLKANNKVFFKAKNEDELALATLALGQNNAARKAQANTTGNLTTGTSKTQEPDTNSAANTAAANSKSAVKTQNTTGEVSVSKTEEVVSESDIEIINSEKISDTEDFATIDLDGAGSTGNNNPYNAVYAYRSASNPNAKLKEYSYSVKSKDNTIHTFKFIGPEGLDNKGVQKLMTIDMNRKTLCSQIPKYNQYSAGTQIRLAQLLVNNPSQARQIKELILAAKDEASCLNIIKDNQLLAQKLNDIKQLETFFKPNDFDYLGGLLDVKATDPAKYQRIADSGIFELIKEGKVDAKAIRFVNKNADLSDDIYNDLALIKSGKSIVPEFPEGTDLQSAFAQTSTGDAVEVGSKMYINDGDKLVEWNMTKEKYLELFPPVQRFATSQGAIGNCHLIQSLGVAMHNPKARAQFLQSFEMQGNDVVVTVKSLEDYNGSVTFPNGEITLASNGKHLKGCTGLQMYEQTYSKVALRENTNVSYPSIASIDDIMTRSETGQAAQTMGDIFGQGAVTDLLQVRTKKPDGTIGITSSYTPASYLHIPFENNGSIASVDLNMQKDEATKMFVFNKYFTDFPDKTLALSKLTPETTETLLANTAGNQDFMISFGTVSKPGAGIESDLLPEYNIVSGHAYSIIGYDASTKMVKIANPHSYSAVTEIPLDTLQKYISHLDFIKL